MAKRKHQWEEYEGESIEGTELPENIKRRLIAYGISTIGDLRGKSEDFLGRIPLNSRYSFGKRRIEQVQTMLASRGLPQLPKYVVNLEVPAKPPQQK